MKDKKVNDVVSTPETASKEKSQKGAKKPNFFVRTWRKISNAVKGSVSELKKVTWPTFDKVLKNLGIVFAVVIVFLVIITAFDYGFGQLLKLVTNISK